jgi:hypothetical protein
MWVAFACGVVWTLLAEVLLVLARIPSRSVRRGQARGRPGKLVWDIQGYHRSGSVDVVLITAELDGRPLQKVSVQLTVENALKVSACLAEVAGKARAPALTPDDPEWWW